MFARIRREHPDGQSLAGWPTAEEKRRLVEKTGVLFVFASTVSRFLSDEGFSPRTNLKTILRGDVNHADTSPFRFLDRLYLDVLSTSLGVYRGSSRASVIRRVVATVVLAAIPLTVEALADIVGEDVHAVVRSLSSVLLVPDLSLRSEQPVRAFHPSLHDFITNGSRCTDPLFVVDPATEHGRLAARCFQQMQGTLRKDICGIGDPSLLNSEVPDLRDRILRHLSTVLCYACLYWHVHLSLAYNPDSELLALFTSFCM
jgi:hypothetical protein